MNVHTNFAELENKLSAVCEENSLLYRFTHERDPIILTIEPDTSLDGQISMLEDGNYPAAPGAAIQFIFRDGELSVRQKGSMELTDQILNKLKSIAKKMHYAWLQVFFHEATNERLNGYYGYYDRGKETARFERQAIHNEVCQEKTENAKYKPTEPGENLSDFLEGNKEG